MGMQIYIGVQTNDLNKENFGEEVKKNIREAGLLLCATQRNWKRPK